MVGLVLLFVAPPVSAQAEAPVAVTGTVSDRSGRPIAGAEVSLGQSTATTDDSGSFTLEAAAGMQLLHVAHPSFLTVERLVEVRQGMSELEIRLPATLAVSDMISVHGVRAGDEVPVTKKTLARDQIEALSFGQDMPALLQYTPSVTWYSDAGTGSNYSYLSLRGINQTRINMTLDGAPLADPAEHALYFNNFHDLASAVESVQIQRGVGTSTVGSPAYGGSVNFASRELSEERSASARFGLGSYASRRASVAVGSGRLDNGLAFEGRLSFAESRGYRDRSGTSHDTMFFNAGWEGERSRLKLVSFAGRERSQLSFLAVEPEVLALDPRFNPLAEEERDRFSQQFVQLQYSRALGEKNMMMASLYANAADGWFRLWDDPEARGELLEFGIDQHFVGSMVNLTRVAERLTATVGVHFNDFRGVHTLDVGRQRLYRNTGLKRQASAFLKLERALGDWSLYGDLQVRWAEFGYRGGVALDEVEWTFADPKIGARYRLSPRTSVYASVGSAEREPSRLDLLSGEDNATVKHDLQAVRPERVVDFEAGLEHRGTAVTLQAAIYSMEFSDEIAATGELSEVGLPLRVNVDESYRRGVELDLRWRLGRSWLLSNSSSVSRNRIREWTQFYDVYDDEGTWLGSEPRVHRNVEHLLTPEIILNQSVGWAGRRRGRAADATMTARWVGPSHLDNTGNDQFRAAGFWSLDLRGSIDLGSGGSSSRTPRWPRVTLHVNNLLDATDRYPAGYSYLFLARDAEGTKEVDGIRYYYPLAGRNLFLTLEFTL